MADVQFNNQGVPLLAYGKKYFAATTGTPKPDASKQTEVIEDKTQLGKLEIASWGPANDFPTTAFNTIRSVGVLNTGLKFIRNFTLGQGIFPCRVKDYDEQRNEAPEVINDAELIKIWESRIERRYLEKQLRDYLKIGVGNV